MIIAGDVSIGSRGGLGLLNMVGLANGNQRTVLLWWCFGGQLGRVCVGVLDCVVIVVVIERCTQVARLHVALLAPAMVCILCNDLASWL